MNKAPRCECRRQERDKKNFEKSQTIPYVRYEDKKRKKAQPNRKSPDKTTDEEMKDRQDTVEKTATVYSKILPALLKKLSRIQDPRQPGKIKHQMTVLMIYGILLFVYQVGSRRNGNKNLTTPIFLENIRAVFPEFESIPHADTLARLLEKIKVEEIQDCLVELLKDLMKNKKFKNQLINNRYLVAVDGTQKFFKDYEWQEEALHRRVGKLGEKQYYVYALESVLILDNGCVLPVLSEILENKDWIEGETKQDCERKAFKRLAPKLYKLFGKGKMTLLGDGLYSCGPVITICRKYGWDFMLVLKKDGLSDVWKEAEGLMRLEPENSLAVKWGDREQFYRWANDIEYEYVEGHRCRKEEVLHVVVCVERWVENHSRSTKTIEHKETQYAWISDKKFSLRNVFMRCTKMARPRWKIENNFLIEKHQGYFFEECYSYNWNAMKGFHYLMKIGHFINQLAINSEILLQYVDDLGIRGFISKVFKALNGSLLDIEKIQSIRERQHIWKLKVAS